MSDPTPQQPASLTMAALFWLVTSLMALSVLYALAMVLRNWSHIGV